MKMDFMDELIEVMFMTLAEINEGLHGLVWICRYVLFLAFLNDLGSISHKAEKI